MTLLPDPPSYPEQGRDDLRVRALLDQLDAERERAQHLEARLEKKSLALSQANASLVALARQVDRMVRERTEDLARDRAAAEAENAAKTQFLATMSHEIRTPLNGVLGMAAVLADTPLAKEQEQVLDILRDSGRLLLNIVDDILDLTKIEEGKLELEQLPTDISALIDAICRQFEPRISAKGLRFTQCREGGLSIGGVWVSLDLTRFLQVLTNLLSNAVKFTSQGEISLNAHLQVEPDETLLLSVAVRDTGMGINAANLGRLFQPYMQADASVHRSHGGTGLGLVIARQICQRMGGDLVCESVAGQGSLFRATFRVSRAEAVVVEHEDAAQIGSTVLSSRRWRILVAEDNRTNRMVLHHMLKSYDLELIWAEQGEEAVEACMKRRPDLVLMDVNMPVLDGVSATARIREMEQAEGRAPVPIIAVSANAMVHQVRSYLERGMSDHVAKPVRKTRLLHVMSEALLGQGERSSQP